MLVYYSLCVCNLFIRAGNRGRWPASVKLVTLHYIIEERPTTDLASWKFSNGHSSATVIWFISCLVLCVYV